MLKNLTICMFVLCIGLGCAVEGSRPGDLNREVDSLSRGQMEGMMEFLSSDLLEGRAPGTRGGRFGGGVC